MNIIIKPLESDMVKNAIELVVRVFPYEDKTFIQETIAKSIDFFPQAFSDNIVCTFLRYFVAVDTDIDKIVGITGLYANNFDEHEAFWISWFCVDPGYRWQGIGTNLLEFTIVEAKKNNKNFLRVYTEEHPNEVQAHKLYEKHNFIPFEPKHKVPFSGQIIYKQLKLV